MKFEIQTIDDEQEAYLIDGKEISSSNHDDHGWSGMGSMRDMFTSIAKHLGAEVIHTDREYSEDNE